MSAGESIRNYAFRLSEFLSSFKWLTDCYMIEFFTNSHWEKVPSSWKKALDHVSLEEFCSKLFGIRSLRYSSSISDGAGGSSDGRIVLPLSLLAFVASASSLAYPDHFTQAHSESCVNGNKDSLSQIPGVHHMFRRHVSLKKQHEIKQLGEVISELCRKTDCNNIIDMGCGQGHLARYLAFNYGLNVIAVEAVESYVETAAKYVQEIDRDFDKLKSRAGIKLSSGTHHTPFTGSVPPTGSVNYIKQAVYLEEPLEDVLDYLLAKGGKIQSCTSSSEGPAQSFVIVGLHACGDLSPCVLRTFVTDQRIVGLVSVGCCYMKLSCDSHMENGYPMSRYISSLKGHQLNYEARELACHSRNVYLKNIQDCEAHQLMIHCYRAAVEVIFKNHGLCRPQVKIRKSVSKLPFEKYAEAVLNSAGVQLTSEDLDAVRPLTNQWEKVVMFFLLRLMVAPCVETMILLDRAMYLLELGVEDISLRPCFDPMVSPRNLVLTSSAKR